MDASKIFESSDRKVVCLVGAGGKKTTMYALSQSLPGTVALSSTTHMYHYDSKYVNRLISVKNQDYLAFEKEAGKVHAFFGEKIHKERVSGLNEEVLRNIWNSGNYDTMIIKADGARARLIKAPGVGEPLIPSFADYVIPIFSIKVVGRKLDSSIAHRIDQLSRVMKIEPGEVIQDKHVISLMTSEAGFLKHTEGKQIIPIINMVDSKVDEQVALRIAEKALALTNSFQSIMLGAMNKGLIKKVVLRK